MYLAIHQLQFSFMLANRCQTLVKSMVRRPYTSAMNKTILYVEVNKFIHLNVNIGSNNTFSNILQDYSKP